MRAVRADLAVVLCAVGFVAVMTLTHDAVPVLGDYAEWTYHGVLLRDVLRGHADAGYRLKNYPVPNSLTTVAVGLLMSILPWKIAAKVWLLCEMILGIVAVMAMQIERQLWRMVVLLPAMVLGITFWAGFTNFMFGLYFAMLLCALLLRRIETGWLIAGVLLLTFFSHMIPFGFALLVLALYAAQNGRWHLLLAALPSLILCGCYFIGRMLHGDADGQAGMVASVSYRSPLFVAFKANSYLKCWGFVNPAMGEHDSVLLNVVGWKVFAGLLVLDWIIAVVVLGRLIKTARHAFRATSSERFVWLGITAFFFAALLLPGAALGISDPGGRMVQVAVWCGVCLIRVKQRWVGALLSGCALVLLAVDCWMFAAFAICPPIEGALDGPLPARVREFGHVYYADHWEDYRAIEQGKMDLEIYPTALFLRQDRLIK